MVCRTVRMGKFMECQRSHKKLKIIQQICEKASACSQLVSLETDRDIWGEGVAEVGLVGTGIFIFRFYGSNGSMTCHHLKNRFFFLEGSHICTPPLPRPAQSRNPSKTNIVHIIYEVLERSVNQVTSHRSEIKKLFKFLI